MSHKKQLRADFRDAVFARDGWKCAMCGRGDVKLDAHHIIDRHDMPHGGYVAENGITLCDVEQGCHWKAERWHATGVAHPGYSPQELFDRIGSSLDAAIAASEALGE